MSKIFNLISLVPLIKVEAVVRRCSVKKVFLEKFTGKYLYQSFFFNKVAGLRPAILFKKRLRHSYFPVHFAVSKNISNYYRTHLLATSVKAFYLPSKTN